MTCCVAGGRSKHVEFVLAYAGWGGFRNAFLSDEGGRLHKILLVVIETRLSGSIASQTDPPRQYLWVFYHFRPHLKALPLRPFMCSCRLVVFRNLAFSRGCF